MPTSWNIGLQIAAVVVAAAFRVAAPGWMLLVVVFFVVPLLVALVPLALAIGTVRRRRLAPAVAAPFVASAVGLVVVAAFYPDFDDVTSWVPVLRGLDVLSTETAQLIADIALIGYLAALVWLVVAIAVTRRARARADAPGHPPAV
jgi:hypothetical protein